MPNLPTDKKSTTEKEADPWVPSESAEKSDPAPAAEKTAAAKPSPLVGGLGATLSEQKTRISALLYGPEGSGKSSAMARMTLMCGPGQRILIVDAEGGLKIQALKQRGVDVSKIEVWPSESDGGASAITHAGMSALADALAEDAGKTYVGVGWDSGTEITRRILDDVIGTAAAKDERLGKTRGQFQINLEDHGVASSMLRDLLRKFRDLPMHFVITALERRDVDGDTGKVKYGPAMSPAMANDCAGLVDIVGYCTVDQVGKDGVEIRSARFTPLELRRAKDRFGMLPSKMADPFLDRIVAYIDGDLTKENDPVQKNVRDLAMAAKEAAATGPANKEENK